MEICAGDKLGSHAITNEEGRFVLEYSPRRFNGPAKRELCGIPPVGYGVDLLMAGIPITERNLDLGDVYQKDNHFVQLKLKVNRQTSSDDTLYFGFFKIQNDYIMGPFEDGQVIDTFCVSGIQIFDIDNIPRQSNPERLMCQYKIGYNSNEMWSTGYFRPCDKASVLNLVID